MKKLKDFIEQLDRAVSGDPSTGCCEKIKNILSNVVSRQELELDPSFLMPVAGGYARRLLHKDPGDRYEVRVMVWDKMQGTALHDHAGLWCVECVYQGTIRVTSFSKTTDASQSAVFEFRKQREVIAQSADAGALIPPFDYHTIDNPFSEPAVTLHVYGGGMNWCNVFEPIGNGKYRQVRRELKDTE